MIIRYDRHVLMAKQKICMLSIAIVVLTWIILGAPKRQKMSTRLYATSSALFVLSGLSRYYEFSEVILKIQYLGVAVLLLARPIDEVNLGALRYVIFNDGVSDDVSSWTGLFLFTCPARSYVSFNSFSRNVRKLGS